MNATLLVAALVLGAGDPPADVRAFLDELDFQRERTVKQLMESAERLLKSDKRVDKKEGRAVKQRATAIEKGGDFVPSMFISDKGGDRTQRRPIGEVNADRATVVSVNGSDRMTVELGFTSQGVRVDTSRGVERGQVRLHPTLSTRTKMVRVEGVTTSGLVVGEPWNPSGIFQAADANGELVLRPYDTKAFEQWRKANPMTKGKKSSNLPRRKR